MKWCQVTQSVALGNERMDESYDCNYTPSALLQRGFLIEWKVFRCHKSGVNDIFMSSTSVLPEVGLIMIAV